MISTLMKLGLSEKEAKVYLAALELGEDTVQNIGKKAGVNRATTYVILEGLLKLGLVSTHIEGKKTVFVAEDPHELNNIIEEQKRVAEAKRADLAAVMTELTAIANKNQSKPAVRYFEGAEGLEALDRYGYDQFKEGSESLGITPIDIVEERFPERRRKAVDDRVKLGIRSRTIYTHKNGEIPKLVNEKELRDAVFIPRNEFPIDASVQIYCDWGVKFYNFSKQNYFGILIQSPDLARNMTEIFELAWETAKGKERQRHSK